MFGAPNFDEGTEKTPSYMDFELKLWPLESFLEIVAEDAWYSIVSERLGFVHAFRFVSFRSSSWSCSSSSLCVLSLLKAESDTEKKKEDRENVRAKMKKQEGRFCREIEG